MKVLTMEKEAHQLNSFIYRYNPDLILLDVSYIKKNHNTVQETIIKYNIPVIVLSSRSVHDTAKTVFAITNGASDFILIDQLDERNNQHEAIKKINYVVSSRPLKKQPKQVDEVNTSYKSQYSPKKTKELTNENNLPISFAHIVAIGTSTGGPKALQSILRKFPKNFPAPIVIVQHMPAGFTKSLAKRLDDICQISVKEATNNEKLQQGTAYIAPGDYHMIINESYETIIFTDDARDGHRPSVNLLFESLAKLRHINKIAVILTGMGKDGATGVMKMKKEDYQTVVIIESEETAIVHGMPSATLKTGYVTEVARLDEIGETIIKYTRK